MTTTADSLGLAPRPALWLRGLFALAAVKLALHLAVGGRYGIFIDELYYLACARHLDFGYVDHPPMIAVVAAAAHAVFGDWLPGLRLPSMLAGAGTLIVGGAVARELGGGRFAQMLTALALFASPLLLNLHAFLSMNSLDVLLAGIAFWLLARIGRHVADGGAAVPTRLWLGLGAVLGLGLQTKLSILFLGAGLGVGLVATASGRRLLATRGPYLAAGLAGLLFLPHVLWQHAHGWPTLEFMHNATQLKNRPLGLGEFLFEHVVQTHPVGFTLLAAGLIHLAIHPTTRGHRLLAWIYPVAAALFLWRGGKPYYLGTFILPLLAAGAVFFESWTVQRSAPAVWRGVFVAGLVVSGLILAPITLPVLPVEQAVAYFEAQGGPGESSERKEIGPLPQHFADMFGHEELARAVATVHDTVRPTTDRPIAIYGASYAQAGAIDFFGPDLGLPPAMSGHNSYWLWGPTPDADQAEVWIVAARIEREALEELFDEVELADRVSHPYAMPWRNDYPIWVARGPKGPIDALWPELKHFE